MELYLTIKILLSLFGIICLYYFIKIIINIKTNKKYYKKINYNNIKNKINNISFVNKIQYNILEIEKSINKKMQIITPIKILFLSIILFIISFIISYNFFNIISTSFIISLFSFFIPYILIQKIVNNQKQKILEMFPNYAISLKNYTNTTNDILVAFRKAKTDSPLSIYIEKFNVSNSKGINIFDSFEMLKENINIKKINDFLTAAQYCYINGGDFSNLLDKYSKILMKSNLQREKEKEKGFSAKIVLIILILMNIYIVFGFILSNTDYRNIISGTFLGKVILNMNFISYFLIFFIIEKLNKMEE